MMLPNRCSFSAHQRMHRNRPPHVCPECGGNFLQANFQTHLREACLHFSRRVGYRCLDLPSSVPTPPRAAGAPGPGAGPFGGLERPVAPAQSPVPGVLADAARAPPVRRPHHGRERGPGAPALP